VNLTTSTGVTQTLLYFYESGNKVLVIEAGDLTSELEVTVKNLTNPDVKCVKSTNTDTCIQCVTGAQLFDGKCECTLNSNYSYDSRSCLCNEGFSSTNNYCVQCGKYYSKSEVSAKFSSDFTKILITFAVQPVIFSDCNKFLIIPTALQNYSFTCTWENSLTLSIKFLTVPPSDLVIGIDPLKLQKVSEKCSFVVDQLSLVVSYDGKLPVPDSAISAPDVFSLACSRFDLAFTTTNSGKDAVYKWSGVCSPENSEVSDYLDSISNHFGKIPLSILTLGTLSLTVNVSTPAFRTYSVTTKEVKIDSSPYLTIQLSSGSSISIKRSSPLLIKSLIQESCGNSDYTYKWTYLSSSPSLDFSSILSINKRENTLLIPSDSLQAGFSYEFQVQVSDGSASGSAAVLVNVQSSRLSLVLSRSSGSVGTDSDFTVKAIASDPDSIKSSLKYLWTCKEASSECLDNSGQALFDSETLSELTVNKLKLRNKAVYVFSVTVSNEDKSESISIEINVQSGIKGQVIIQQALSKINVDKQMTILPTVVDVKSTDVEWSVVQGPSFDLSSKYSFMTIEALSLTEGSFYQLKLSLKSSGLDVEALYSFFTNSPPTCEGLLQETDGNKLVLTANGCVDGDDSDYPLAYQFGASIGKKKVWLTSASLLNEFRLLVRTGVTFVWVKVCDSVASCVEIDEAFKNQATRRLDEISDEFDSETSDLENIPSAIVYYSNVATSATIVKMVEKFKTYVTGTYVDENELDLIIDSLFYIFNAKTEVTETQANELTVTLTKVLKGISFDLTDEQVLGIFSCVDENVKLIYPKNMVNLIEIVRYRWILNKTPTQKVTFSSKLFVSMIRSLSSSSDQKISSGKFEILLKKGFITEKNLVIDLTFAKFYEKSLPLFDLSIQLSGKYESNTLTLWTPENFEQTLNASIQVTYYSSEFPSGSRCHNLDNFNWTTTGCEIIDLTEEKITFNLINPMLLKIEKYDYNNFFQGLCIFILYSLLAAGLILISFSCLMDRGLSDVNHQKTLLMLFPLTSVMIPQPRPWRRLYTLHLVTSQSLLLALIGGFYKLYPQDGGFVISTTAKSGICAGLCQALCLSNLILIFSSLKHKKIVIVFYFINLIVLCLSLAIVTVILSFGAESFIYNWVSGYVLFGAIDMVFIEFFYALLIFMRNKKNLKTHHLSNNPSIDSFNKNFEDRVDPFGRDFNDNERVFMKVGRKPDSSSLRHPIKTPESDKKFNTHYH
jgi:predicted transcriptional regulator